MKFSEKLIQLRKKEGLSQEELGHRLNVTRQTVSKWELGQTTPDMDKLLEISKIFNVTTDELIGEVESETIKSTIVNENQTKSDNNRKIIIIICAVVVGILLLGLIGSLILKTVFGNFFGFFNSQLENSDKIYNAAQDIITNVEDQINNNSSLQDDLLDNSSNILEKFEEGIAGQLGNFELNRFNSVFEFYQGTKYGSSVRNLLDEVIKNNKKEDSKITVKFLGHQTADAEEIKNLKVNIDDLEKYEVSFEYNEKGYIYETIVEEIINNKEQ